MESVEAGQFSVVYGTPESWLKNERWRCMLSSQVYLDMVPVVGQLQVEAGGYTIFHAKKEDKMHNKAISMLFYYNYQNASFLFRFVFPHENTSNKHSRYTLPLLFLVIMPDGGHFLSSTSGCGNLALTTALTSLFQQELLDQYRSWKTRENAPTLSCEQRDRITMAEATVDSERHSTLALKSFQRWRENRGKRDLKSAGNHRFANAAESIILMQKGNEFIKLRNASKKYPRTYFLDDDLVNICWTPSKKGDRARIPLNSLKEIREGTMSDAFSQCNEVFPEERCFSIIHGDTFVPLDLVASTREESVHWLIGLRYLMAKHLGEDELSQRQKARDQYGHGQESMGKEELLNFLKSEQGVRTLVVIRVVFVEVGKLGYRAVFRKR
ncbi:hypothetical protein QZH41_002586 [Actinostola sp. cb2023]|nr:hypothetical protein QZH41_002586 [Actinostola sp. cb2023]